MNVAATDSTTAPGASTSTDFEAFVRNGITDIQNKLEGLESSLDFQAQRTTDLEQRMSPVEIHVKELQNKVETIETELRKAEEKDNKLERFSRRNNIRIVGIERVDNENLLTITAKIFEKHFGIKPSIERAHRDGRANNGNQHVLLKLLSYQDKRDIMRRRREVLKDESFFIIDDLTKKDLDEKRKYAKEAAEAYRRGERLHFAAGKWRSKNGLADFYTSRNNPASNAEPAAP